MKHGALGGAKFYCYDTLAHSGGPARQCDNAVDEADGKEDSKEYEKADPKRDQTKRGYMATMMSVSISHASKSFRGTSA